MHGVHLEKTRSSSESQYHAGSMYPCRRLWRAGHRADCRMDVCEVGCRPDCMLDRLVRGPQYTSRCAYYSQGVEGLYKSLGNKFNQRILVPGFLTSIEKKCPGCLALVANRSNATNSSRPAVRSISRSSSNTPPRLRVGPSSTAVPGPPPRL